MDNMEAQSGSESDSVPEHVQRAMANFEDTLSVEHSRIREMQARPPRDRHCLVLPVATITMFLALVNIAAGMTAREGDPWKLAFMGLFVMWLGFLCVGLYLDMRDLERPGIIRRLLWHFCSCVFTMFLFAWGFQITADTLPQWIPLLVVCGILAGSLLEGTNSDTLRRMFDYASNIASSICGAQNFYLGARHSNFPSSESPPADRPRGNWRMESLSR